VLSLRCYWYFLIIMNVLLNSWSSFSDFFAIVTQWPLWSHQPECDPIFWLIQASGKIYTYVFLKEILQKEGSKLIIEKLFQSDCFAYYKDFRAMSDNLFTVNALAISCSSFYQLPTWSRVYIQFYFSQCLLF
jgi:hypothetical protein